MSESILAAKSDHLHSIVIIHTYISDASTLLVQTDLNYVVYLVYILTSNDLGRLGRKFKVFCNF